MTELVEGSRAPDFSLKASDGKLYSLKDFRGKKIVLYFYPKDETSGCTKEACSFRDSFPTVKMKGAFVLGISADSVESHRKFTAKHNLNFPLLSDEEKSVINRYNVWKEKKMYGRTYMGIERSTFIIDEQGTIVRIFRKVKVDGHVEEVLNAIQ